MATLINYSHELGLEHNTWGLAVCLGLAEPRFVYMGDHTLLREIWRTALGTFHKSFLTEESADAPTAWQPYTFVDTSINKKFVVFLEGEGPITANKDVHVIYWSPGAIGTKNLTSEATGVNGETPGQAKGKPVAFYSPYHNSYRVIHLSGQPNVPGGHLLSLWWPSLGDPVQYEGDMTASASAPSAVNFTAYASGHYQYVVYTSSDGHIRGLYWTTGAATSEDLSDSAGTPSALILPEFPYRFSPSAYYTPHDRMNHIVYLADDGHLWELYGQEEYRVQGWDLMANLEAPTPESQFVTYYNSGTNTKHIIYPYEGQLHELWWIPGGSEPAHNNLTHVFNLPPYPRLPNNASLVAFAVAGSNSQHVAYRSTDQQIYELIW